MEKKNTRRTTQTVNGVSIVDFFDHVVTDTTIKHDEPSAAAFAANK